MAAPSSKADSPGVAPSTYSSSGSARPIPTGTFAAARMAAAPRLWASSRFSAARHMPATSFLSPGGLTPVIQPPTAQPSGSLMVYPNAIRSPSAAAARSQ